MLARAEPLPLVERKRSERERKVFKKRSKTRARAKGKAHPRSFYTDRPSAAGEDDHLCVRAFDRGRPVF